MFPPSQLCHQHMEVVVGAFPWCFRGAEQSKVLSLLPAQGKAGVGVSGAFPPEQLSVWGRCSGESGGREGSLENTLLGLSFN